MMPYVMLNESAPDWGRLGCLDRRRRVVCRLYHLWASEPQDPGSPVVQVSSMLLEARFRQPMFHQVTSAAGPARRTYGLTFLPVSITDRKALACD